MIRTVFRKNSVPLDISYLPHLESRFSRKARSKAGARGLWQFIPATARLQFREAGFKRTKWHPKYTTIVAAKTFRDYYKKTKSWPLAITAYNYGINGTMRAIKKLKTRSYLKIRMKHRSPHLWVCRSELLSKFHCCKKYC